MVISLLWHYVFSLPFSLIPLSYYITFHIISPLWDKYKTYFSWEVNPAPPVCFLSPNAFYVPYTYVKKQTNKQTNYNFGKIC